MKPEGGIRKTLGVIGYVLACLVLAALVAVAFGVLIETIKLETVSRGRILLHRNLLLGFLAFFLLFIIPRVRSNVRWWMNFNHEFTHMLFALLFFRKIYRFKVDETDSYVLYSGGWFGYHAITLSPYCIPIFTLALLPWHFYHGSGPVSFADRHPHRLLLFFPCLRLGQADPLVADGYHRPRKSEVHPLHRPFPDHQLLPRCPDAFQRSDACFPACLRGFPGNGLLFPV